MRYGRPYDAYADQRIAAFLSGLAVPPPPPGIAVSPDAFDPFGQAAAWDAVPAFLSAADPEPTEQVLSTTGRGLPQSPPYEDGSGRAGFRSQVFDAGPLPSAPVPDPTADADDRRYEDTPEAWGDYHGQVPTPRQGVHSFGLFFPTVEQVKLWVGPLERQYWVRHDPNRMQRDVVIWFHPGGGKVVLSVADQEALEPDETGFLDAIVGDPDRIDVAPQGLLSFGGLNAYNTEQKTNWGLPGLPDEDQEGGQLIPRNMHPLYPRLVGDVVDPPEAGPRVSKWHDLQFVCLLIQDVLRRFPNVRRIWLAGFSKGCTMVSASYAFNNLSHRPEMRWAWPLSLVRGYYLGDFGVTMVGTRPNVDGCGWNLVDGIDWGWVLTNSSPTRRADDPGQASGVMSPMNPIVRPVLFRHGSQWWDGLPHAQGFAKTWADSAADLLRLHRCPRWNNGLAGTDPGTGWYLYRHPFPKVCEEVGGKLSYRPPQVEGWAAAEYPTYPPTAAGRVRARYAFRDPRFPMWPAPNSRCRHTAPLGEIEVVNADHGNFIVLLAQGCANPYWDEVRLATDFFRDNGLGT